MQLLRPAHNSTLKLDPHQALGAGGEAVVMPVPGEEARVAKVYRRPTEAHARKLACMLANPPDDPMAGQGHVSIAWPQEPLLTADNNRWVVGFLMAKAPGERPLLEYYNPGKRRTLCPLFSYQYLHRTARNLAAAVAAIHARGYVIGDLNESNILVTDTALVTLVDCDSFQVRDQQSDVVYRCPVGKPEFTPPELQSRSFRDLDRGPEHDLFGLAVLIFQILMEGTHPFAGVFTGEGEPPPIEARIRAGHFPYGSSPAPYRPAPLAPHFELLVPELRHLFRQCFEEGRAHPAQRPSADLWVNALHLAESSLLTCGANDQHRFGKHLTACPWCERTARLRGRDPFPSREAVSQGLHLAAAAPNQTALPSAGVAPRPAAAPVAASVPAVPSPPPPRMATAVPAAPSPAHNPPSSRPASPPPPAPASAVSSMERDVFKPWGAVALVLALGALAFPKLYMGLGPAALVLGLAGWAMTAGGVALSRWLALGAVLLGLGMTGIGGYTGVSASRKEAQAAQARRQRQVEIQSEITAATVLVDDVMRGIERFKNESLTEREADLIREELRVKLENAVKHADRALTLDRNSEAAWVQKTRALRLSNDDEAAKVVLRQGLALFPASADLKEQQELLEK